MSIHRHLVELIVCLKVDKDYGQRFGRKSDFYPNLVCETVITTTYP